MEISSFRVLGVPVSAIQIPPAISVIEDWITERASTRYVAVTGMHGIMEAQRCGEFKSILSHAGLVVPDGMPLVWLGRTKGFPLRRRVYGPELMDTFCKTTAARYRHFFYGGAEGVAELLAKTLHERYGIRIAGAYSPPFRQLTAEEESAVAGRINSLSPDIVWVGLSTPKQERWMGAFQNRLNVPVLVGVGAAFDFATGRARQAPIWMQENGLEWLFRLSTEPRRLWRRYLIYGSQFVWNVSLERLKLKNFD
jgi:N-acetylglucosaminyldiphosphoundecaprenol N-acetyl-beta-D-mannosaminyltransferase